MNNEAVICNRVVVFVHGRFEIIHIIDIDGSVAGKQSVVGILIGVICFEVDLLLFRFILIVITIKFANVVRGPFIFSDVISNCDVVLCNVCFADVVFEIFHNKAIVNNKKLRTYWDTSEDSNVVIDVWPVDCFASAAEEGVGVPSY